MIRAVLDTNVVVSAPFKPTGPLALILNLAALRRFRCYVSEDTLTEYQEVLARPRLRFHTATVQIAIRRLRRSSILVQPAKKVHVCSDPEDNIFLECALEARADYVVTANVAHFPARFQDIRVVTPRQFITYLSAELR